MNLCLRLWGKFQIDDVKSHLLVVGDSFGDCASCRELGLDPWKVPSCPACHTKFLFIASRRAVTHPSERFIIAKRIMEKRPDLRMIDYEDFQKAVGSQAAKNFFSQ